MMKARLLILLLIAQPLTVAATPPSAPVEVSILSAKVETANNKSQVTLTVDLAVIEPSPIRLRVFVRPVTGSPVADAKVFDQVLSVDKSTTLAIAIPVKDGGEFRVNAIAEQPKGGVSDGASTYVRLSEDGEIKLLTPAEFNVLRARKSITDSRSAPQEPSVLNTPDATKVIIGSGKVTTSPGATKSGAQNVAAGTDYLTLSGSISTSVNQQNVPMANVTIQVWDSDTISPDDRLGTVMTDENGNYNITVVNDDGPFGGGVDVYLYIYSKYSNVSMIQLVPDGEGGYVPFNYAWRSPTVNNITAPIYTMNFSITDQAEEAAGWMGASRASYLVSTATGKTLAYVEIRNPGLSSGTFFDPSKGYINIDPNDADAPEVVAHEYGHAVMYQAYGSIPGEGGVHFYCRAASQGLAWSEGFATALGLVVGNANGIDHWHVGDEGLSIENWNCNLQTITTDEGRVAAGLWDLYDAANDDNGGDPKRGAAGVSDTNQGGQLVPLALLLKPLWAGVQNNVTDYWNVLKPQLNGDQIGPSTTIMQYNYYNNP